LLLKILHNDRDNKPTVFVHSERLNLFGSVNLSAPFGIKRKIPPKAGSSIFCNELLAL